MDNVYTRLAETLQALYSLVRVIRREDIGLYILHDTCGDINGIMCEFCGKEKEIAWTDSPSEHWHRFQHSPDCPLKVAIDCLLSNNRR